MSKLKSILEQSCPDGEAWCPIHKKCIPKEDHPGKGKHFGQGKGPIGTPKKEQKIDQLIDEVFDGGFDKLNGILAIETQVDETLDKFDKKADPVNVKISPTMTGGVDVKISESDILDIVENLREDNKYKEYFKNKLKDAGYDSPKDIPDDKKKEFFRSVDYGWKAQNESALKKGIEYGGAAVTGGMVGLIINKKICQKRFSSSEDRKQNQVAYNKCLKNPFRKSAKRKINN